MIERFNLRVFRIITETLDFSRAGEEIHLSQSAVMPLSRSLDEVPGIALFDRTERRATVTPAGKTLLRSVVIATLALLTLIRRLIQGGFPPKVSPALFRTVRNGTAWRLP